MYHSLIENNVEDWFYHEFNKRTAAQIIPQHQVTVNRYTTYRLDFLVKSPLTSIGVEIDGKDFHDTKRDYQRDLKILDHRKDISAIIRFEAHDLHYNAPLTTIFLSNLFPATVIRYGDRSKGAQSAKDVMEKIKKQINGELEPKIDTDKAVSDAKRYMKVQGVYGYQLLSTQPNNGYLAYNYGVDFMDYEREEEYRNDLQDMEDSMMYDYYGDREGFYEEVKRRVDWRNYTYQKISQVNVLTQKMIAVQ